MTYTSAHDREGEGVALESTFVPNFYLDHYQRQTTLISKLFGYYADRSAFHEKFRISLWDVYITPQVPELWKRGFITPIPKIPKPETCNDLRPVTITSIFARIAESFPASWIKDDTRPHLDPHQYGNREKTSTSHYLLYLIDFLYKTTDNSNKCVAVLSIDFSKAFDRVDHTIALQHLLNNGMRGELVAWVSSFLTGRSQVVRYCGTTSTQRNSTCGVPQGTVLGPLIFNNHVNSAGQTEPVQCKFVDDLTIACTYDINNAPDTQDQANRVLQWSKDNNMSDMNPVD
ncbi:hypothetical protein Pmani_013047 [Petrolisthes manimaculis]|uniref:Reverse transcriptase domain-containing protein n=1 Tax=Petrolisthes manimaculis TaxID=1843537 RepID=A0AAE1UCK9_9EUCA|nr:hypothetical protein Pmani_013047 [Petrolisthes manimaculis]